MKDPFFHSFCECDEKKLVDFINYQQGNSFSPSEMFFKGMRSNKIIPIK